MISIHYRSIIMIATWMASQAAEKLEQGIDVIVPWGNTLGITGLTTSMTVNALVTSLIIFKILKVFLDLKPTSIERTLGSSSGGSSNLRHIIFIIIESGMALFAIQLVRVVLTSVVVRTVLPGSAAVVGMEFVIGIHEMLNVMIIIIIKSTSFCFTDAIFTTT
jgi:hypothetical protein